MIASRLYQHDNRQARLRFHVRLTYNSPLIGCKFSIPALVMPKRLQSCRRTLLAYTRCSRITDHGNGTGGLPVPLRRAGTEHLETYSMRKLIIAATALAFLSSTAFAQSTAPGTTGPAAQSGDNMSKGDMSKGKMTKTKKKSKKSSTMKSDDAK
jgi:hypothetical protein